MLHCNLSHLVPSTFTPITHCSIKSNCLKKCQSGYRCLRVLNTLRNCNARLISTRSRCSDWVAATISTCTACWPGRAETANVHYAAVRLARWDICTARDAYGVINRWFWETILVDSESARGDINIATSALDLIFLHYYSKLCWIGIDWLDGWVGFYSLYCLCLIISHGTKCCL